MFTNQPQLCPLVFKPMYEMYTKHNKTDVCLNMLESLIENLFCLDTSGHLDKKNNWEWDGQDCRGQEKADFTQFPSTWLCPTAKGVK